jgi:hypothetical protein
VGQLVERYKTEGPVEELNQLQRLGVRASSVISTLIKRGVRFSPVPSKKRFSGESLCRALEEPLR